MRVAAINWKIRRLSSEDEFFGHLEELVELCAHGGAQLFVFPELVVLELLSLLPDETPHWLARFAPAYEAALVRLATRHGVTIVGGSHFSAEAAGVFNVCAIAHPDGTLKFQPKVKLTMYERQEWAVTPGRGLTPLVDGRLGVTVCYDSEFPEAGRFLAERGVLVHCVPAFTETVRGFQRVRWACHARAVENQIFTVHTSLVGDLGREPVPSTHGSSAVIAPSIEPFPESAVLAETPLNEEAIAFADLDFGMLLQAREQGDVRNWNDRSAQDWA